MSRSRRGGADAGGSLAGSWRRLGVEQRVAAVGALALIVSTFGPFSLVEAGIVLTAGGVLVLLKKRADRRQFHLPFGDGTVILAAGVWSALLIAVRLFDRPLGQSVLALACAAILAGAGMRERSERPADDLPPAPEPASPPRADLPASGGPTLVLSPQDDATERSPVPERASELVDGAGPGSDVPRRRAD